MIITRPLNVNDAEALRKVRLRSLREDGKYFTADLSEEMAWTLEQWKIAATETTNQAMLGAFENGKLVGIMGVREWQKDSSGKTAYWRAAYVAPEYRGNAVAKKLYTLLNEWTINHGYTNAVLSIHPENVGTIALVTHSGAAAIKEEPLRFADGRIANAIWFQKPLSIKQPSSAKLLASANT